MQRLLAETFFYFLPSTHSLHFSTLESGKGGRQLDVLWLAASWLMQSSRKRKQRSAAAAHCDGGKDCWSPEEDARLTDLVQARGLNWSQVASELAGRTAKSCRLRWHNHLRPGIKRGPFTKYEQAVIILMQDRDSTRNKWAAMAQLLPGRVDNAIKNHWHATLSRRLKEGSVNNSYTRAGYSLEKLLNMGPPAADLGAATSSGLDSASWRLSSDSGSADCLTAVESGAGLDGGADPNNCFNLSPSLLPMDSLPPSPAFVTQDLQSAGSSGTWAQAPLPNGLQPKGTNARTRKVLQQLFGGSSAQPAAKRAALAAPRAAASQPASLWGGLLSHAWSAPADFSGAAAADGQAPTETFSMGLLGRSGSSTIPSGPWSQPAGSSLDADANGSSALQPSMLLSWLQFGGSTSAVAGSTGTLSARGWQPTDADALAALVERVASNSNGSNGSDDMPALLVPPSAANMAATAPVLVPGPRAGVGDRLSSSGGGFGSGLGLVAGAGGSFDGLQPEWLEQALLEDDMLPPFDADEWTPLELQQQEQQQQ